MIATLTDLAHSALGFDIGCAVGVVVIGYWAWRDKLPRRRR